MKKLFISVALASSLFASPPFMIYYGDKTPIKTLEKFDVVVLDPESYPDVKAMKNMTYGYVSIGEVENYKPYYKKAIDLKVVGKENPNWKGSYSVILKPRKWQQIIIDDVIPTIRAKGYKGIFLDTVDSLVENNQSKNDIAEFINLIKSKYVDIKVMVNRGFDVLDLVNVDSVLYESTITTYDFDKKKHTWHPAEVKNWLPKTKKTIYSVDYWTSSDKVNIEKIYKEAISRGYKPLVTDINLNTIPKVIYDKGVLSTFNPN
jgi:uncharacterized protein (TIGR01370 family)